METTNCSLMRASSLLVTTSSVGYEVDTHAAITYQAFIRSNLGATPDLLRALGIAAGTVPNTSTFGVTYLEVSNDTVVPRAALLRERTIMRAVNLHSYGLTVPGWLMRGAIREDDLPSLTFQNDDPYNAMLVRVLSHFFDPIALQRLTVDGVTLGEGMAPSWALSTVDQDTFDSPNTRDTARKNHFTVFDAREAMYRALTLRQRMSDGSISGIQEFLNIGLGATLEQRMEATRKAYWATLFRALGDVVHLNQDMAQPQHTRNEAHSGLGPEVVEALATDTRVSSSRTQLGVRPGKRCSCMGRPTRSRRHRCNSRVMPSRLSRRTKIFRMRSKLKATPQARRAVLPRSITPLLRLHRQYWCL